MSDDLIRRLRSGRSNNSLIETVGGCQHYISCLKAADTIETLHAKIAELQADVETLQADVALSDVCCLDYKKRIAELEEKITRYKERYHNTRHENTRLDAALAEALDFINRVSDDHNPDNYWQVDAEQYIDKARGQGNE